jgi:hypothetical protein
MLCNDFRRSFGLSFVLTIMETNGLLLVVIICGLEKDVFYFTQNPGVIATFSPVWAVLVRSTQNEIIGRKSEDKKISLFSYRSLSMGPINAIIKTAFHI